MREDDGVAFLAQAVDFGAQVEAREILADGSSHGVILMWLCRGAPLHAAPLQGNSPHQPVRRAASAMTGGVIDNA